MTTEPEYPGRRAKVMTLSAGQRLLIGGALGIVTLGIVVWFEPWQFTLLAGWVVAGLWFFGSVWVIVGPLDAEQTAAYATREDDSIVSSHLWLIGSSLASLLGVGFALGKAKDVSGFEDALLTAGALVAVAVSWLVVHTTFALRYAHLYYSAAPPGGIDFKNGEEEPDYHDFAYVAATVGMTFQVSDTDIKAKRIRRVVLRHALLSFVFGAVILGVTVNLVAGLFR